MSRLQRFYIPPQHNKYGQVQLAHEVWIHDIDLLNQWRKVLRYQVGQQIVLFDGIKHERLYELTQIGNEGAHFKLITDFERKVPSIRLYLFWSLLKKDKNDWVIQKCSELGVSHFIPLIAERSEKTGFNIERAKKIAIEASEQCGRSDIPSIREPIGVDSAIEEFIGSIPLYVCEQNTQSTIQDSSSSDEIGVFVGPEGGWSDQENQLFELNKIKRLNLHDFTLRAETACAAVVTKLLQ